MSRRKELYKTVGLSAEQVELRNICMQDLKGFVGLVAPQRMLGNCHHELLNFLQNSESKNQLVLWPRGHQKSTMVAYFTAWKLICKPETTILYASATAKLAYDQLNVIKNILESPVIQKYWPEFLNSDSNMRSMWRQDEINCDHWKRLEEVIRDPSVRAVGIGANITGTHCDIVILDDVVVDDNARSKEERDKVKRWFSLLASILNPGGQIKAVGTRYNPDDLYNEMIIMTEPQFNEVGEEIGEVNVFDVEQRVVEVDGEFLWPRTQRRDGKWFGFDRTELSRIKAKYLDKVQFFAQYYNDPTDVNNKKIANFQYYDRAAVKSIAGQWWIGGKLLNVYAAIDFASTVTKKADYTAIVVAGIDNEHNIYVLDINRFKTDKISVMADELAKMFTKWKWIKLRGEATAAQNLIINQIKDYNLSKNIFYTIEISKPTIEKQVRIMTNLEPRYAVGKIVHYKGGLCEYLEDELTASRPAHDDIADALAACVEIANPPARRVNHVTPVQLKYHPRFGGIL